MVAITINNHKIDFSQLKSAIIKIDFDNNFLIDVSEIHRSTHKVLFFGMPVHIDGVDNIVGNQLYSLKTKINKNLGLSIIHKIIGDMANYDYIIILSPSCGFDFLEVHYLKKFVKMLFKQGIKVFFIEELNKNKVNFQVK